MVPFEYEELSVVYRFLCCLLYDSPSSEISEASEIILRFVTDVISR